MNKDEKLYLNAKNSYYKGSPIMTDTQFDLLEEKLKNQESSVIDMVGFDESNSDIKHLSPMLSLQKIQVNDLSNKALPISKFEDWIIKHKCQDKDLIAEPKFDGSSCNLTYHNGKLFSASTRGNGLIGTDITDKLSLIVPKNLKISITGFMEIRGEIIIKSKTFNDKYAKDFKNPRNFVAGILGRDDIDPNIISDFEFIAFEYRQHVNGSIIHGTDPFNFLHNIGFVVPKYYLDFQYKSFESVFDQFLNHRIYDSEYGLDGFVIKLPQNVRESIGETDHHPKWAMAIKFPPTECVTYIKNIQWNLGQSGEFKPIGELEPIDLDGTLVSNVALHNIGNIQRLGLFPGAKVTIVKSGDIIPIVRNVIEPKFDNSTKYLPSSCTTPECKIEIQGVHLICTNPNCTDQKLGRLSAGIASFGLENIGGSTIRKLYKAGILTIMDMFDKSKFNKQTLIKSGEFKSGRALDIIFESFEKRKPITYSRIITAIAFKNVGWSTAEEIAKIFEGKIPNFASKSHAAYSPFLNKDSMEYQTVLRFVDIITQNGYSFETEIVEEIPLGSFTYELTGSPKEFGFKTKDEFIALAKSHGYSHTSLNSGTNYLITDDVESTSSKMSKARKLKVAIVTYQEILAKFSI
jgi:DNA ligase (NAD+)